MTVKFRVLMKISEFLNLMFSGEIEINQFNQTHLLLEVILWSNNILMYSEMKSYFILKP